MYDILLIYIIAQQPAYEGLGTSNPLTPLQLESLLTEDSGWLVEFRCVSTPNSYTQALSSLNSQLHESLAFPLLTCFILIAVHMFKSQDFKFSNKNVSFGSVDLGLVPNAAEKFGMSLASLHQLPIYILFHDGIEISRFPELDFEENFFYYPLSKKLLCRRHFELDKLLLDYVNGK